MNKIIYDYVVEMGGKSMALFTSYKSLRNSNKVLKEKLNSENLDELTKLTEELKENKEDVE